MTGRAAVVLMLLLVAFGPCNVAALPGSSTTSDIVSTITTTAMASCGCTNASLFTENSPVAACRKAILIETIDRLINETFGDRLAQLEAAVQPTTTTPTCFAADTRFMLANGSSAPLTAMTTGDILKCVNNTDGTVIDCPITTMGHVEHTLETTFMRLHYVDSQNQPQVLVVTPDHFLFAPTKNMTECGNLPNGDYIAAYNFGVGSPLVVYENDCLRTTLVTAVDHVVQNGFYSPATTTTTVVAEGVVASIYSESELSPDFYDILMSPLIREVESNLPIKDYENGLHPYILKVFEIITTELTPEEAAYAYDAVDQEFRAKNGIMTKEEITQVFLDAKGSL